MSQISISHLTFCYDGSYDPVFQDVSLTIDTDWKLGCTGRNGRGKTTFLKLLSGALDHGSAIVSPVKCIYFPFDVPKPNAQTIDVLEDASRQAPLWQIRRELSLMELEPDDILFRPFSTLSGGERTKSLLCALFLQEEEFLLIDEPTNHLDAQARETVGNYLNRKKGFILVSHDRQLLDHCIDHILSINKTNIDLQQGNFSTWQENKRRQDLAELSENQKLEREVKALSEAARRSKNWSHQAEKEKHTRVSGLRPDRGYLGHKAAKMMKRAMAAENRREKALDEKRSLLKNIEEAQPLFIHPLPYVQNRLCTLEEVQICYDGLPATSPVSLSIERGQRIALCGKNGCGKSSILKLLAGEPIAYNGTFHMGSNITISYVPQETTHLRGDLKDFAKKLKIDESLLKSFLRKLDVSRTQFEKDMGDFSEGQKKKVLLAASLCSPSHLYLWDEPLNYVDVLSRIQLEQLIVTSCPTIVFVEHDRAFTDAVATRKIFL